MIAQRSVERMMGLTPPPAPHLTLSHVSSSAFLFPFPFSVLSSVHSHPHLNTTPAEKAMPPKKRQRSVVIPQVHSYWRIGGVHWAPSTQIADL